MNYKVDKEKVLYADECFLISGVCFYTQNLLGRFAKERQYADLMQQRFAELSVPCKREFVAANTGNRIDLLVYEKILIEIKAKPFLNREDFAQAQRYLKVLNIDLGLLVNFWARSALPHRILRMRDP